MPAPGDTSYREHWFSAQDGLRLYYRDYGPRTATTTPVLCLGGVARNSKDFHHVASRLAERRRVVCPDYRGRGRSAYAPDWRSYRADVHLRDLAHLLVVAGLHHVVVCGTSMGGLLAMAMAVTNPTALAGVILNDVGPDIRPGGLEQIAGYIGRGGTLPDWDAAVATVKRDHAELGYQSEELWLRFAKASYRQEPDGNIRADWDVNLAKAMGQRLPDLWPIFRALRNVPTLAFRGENSSILSAETFAAMKTAIPDLIQVTVRGTGHAPALDEPEATEAIDEFLDAIDA